MAECVRADKPLVNGRIYVVEVKANRCAREVVKGNEREWHKWNLIKGGRVPLEHGIEKAGGRTVDRSHSSSSESGTQSSTTGKRTRS